MPNLDPENSGNCEFCVLSSLNVVGCYKKNEKGKIVNLHGFTQTYSPYFNNNVWSNYDAKLIFYVIFSIC